MSSTHRLLRACGAFAFGLVLAHEAAAQGTQQVCFQDNVPLQSTNWSSTVSIPKFNPNLGTLVSIDFTLTGHSQGAARAESLDAQPSTVTLTFQNTITLTRPDMSVIVVTIPQAVFMDTLSAYDGTTDFAGSSGVAHNGLTAMDSDVATAPPPASDLALFSGAGSIVLPVMAAGTSMASGAGNLITQFVSMASADVSVCYNFIPNTPPAFTAPQCGAQLMASVGVPFTTQVCASDVEANDTVTLTALTLPAGATVTPALPQSGNPVCVTVDWIPTNAQTGVNTFTFQAIDTRGRSTTCGFTVLVAECHLLLGLGTGNEQYTVFGHLYDTQLSQIRRTFPVTMDDIPHLRLVPNQVVYGELVMYNPLVFPQNPSQWSKVCRVTMNPDMSISTVWSGTRNGISLRATTVQVGNETRVVFPFRIDGM